MPTGTSSSARTARGSSRPTAGWRGPSGCAAPPLDFFGCTAARRGERAAIGEFESLMREGVALLTPARLKLALELARLSQGVRGFGHVKERNALAARERQRALLAALGSATPEDGAPARAAA